MMDFMGAGELCQHVPGQQRGHRMRGDDHSQDHRPIPDGQIRRFILHRRVGHHLDERLFERLVDESQQQQRRDHDADGCARC